MIISAQQWFISCLINNDHYSFVHGHGVPSLMGFPMKILTWDGTTMAVDNPTA